MPLREVTCPHCFREVFVNVDALCPACRKNVDERGPDHDNLKLVEFVDGEELPPVCLICGHASQYRVKVGEKNDTRRHDGVGIMARLAGALGGLLAIPIKPAPHINEYKISVQLPVCERHRESQLLTPIHIDYGRYRMTLPAHPEFILRWKQTNAES